MKLTDEQVDRAIVYYTSGVSFIRVSDAQTWYDRLPDKPANAEDFSDNKDLHRYAMRSAIEAALEPTP